MAKRRSDKPRRKRLDELRAFWKKYAGRTWEGFGIGFTEPLTIFQPDIRFARRLQRESIVVETKHRHRWMTLPVSIPIREGRHGKLLGFFNKVCIICGEGK